MSRPISTVVTIVPGNPGGLAPSQVLAAAGPLTLNGPLMNIGLQLSLLDSPRRIQISSSGNDAGIFWTVTGKLRPEMNSIVVSENVQGANGVPVWTINDFATVTSIVGSGPTAGTVQAGTNGIASGPWVVMSGFMVAPMITLAAFVLSGTPTYQVDYTVDDVFGGAWTTPQTVYPRPFGVANMYGLTSTKDGSIILPCRATRLTISAGFGSVQLIQIPQGN